MITRVPPAGWSGFRRRIDREMLADVAWRHMERPRIDICPTGLVDSVANAFIELDYDPGSILTERFGPTG